MADLPFQTEYAKSGRSLCKGCRDTIDQGKVRIAAMVQSAFFDGKQANWYHEDCFFQKQRPQSASDIGKLNTLRNPDRKRITERVEAIGSGAVLPVEGPKTKKGKRKKDDANGAQGAVQDFRIEYSKSSRATCRVCEIKICKGEVRVCKIVFDTEVGQKFGGQPLWHHPKCFVEDRINLGFLASGDIIPGFKELSKDDQKLIKSEIPSMSADAVPIKKLKAEADEIQALADHKKTLEKELEKQSKLFFKYRDALRKNFSKQEMQLMLEENGQEPPAGPDDVLDILADVIAFGALQPCSVCKNGQFALDNQGYVCKGNLSEWTKCVNVTQKPNRVPFKVPSAFKSKAPFKKYKPSVGERAFEFALKPTVFIKPEETEVKKEPKFIPPLKNLNFFIYGKTKSSKEDIKHKILKLGGNVPSKLSKEIAAVISTQQDIEKMSSKMQEISELDIEVVDESYLDLIKKETGTIASSLELIKQHNIAPWGSDPTKRIPQDVLDGKSVYKSGSSLYVKSGKSSSKKLKLKGGTAVDPDSELADIAHVYKDSEGTKWTVVLGKTDIVAQKNSYYKLQLLEADSGNKYWLFRSWGRIGTTIGGNKTEPCKGLHDAMNKFEELYFDKTENPWEMREHFLKVPDKMYPIEVDYGNDENVGPLKEDKNCSLPSSVQNFVMTIFDINLMKKALLEFELDTEKMPLGKLSKKQIRLGFTQLTNLIKLIEKEEDKQKNVAKIIDATNQFFTLIPHDFGVNNAPILDKPELIEKKIEMLSNLLEIEIAYNLLTTEKDTNHSPIEAHYLKLKTEMIPLDPSSPEFEMLSKYVKNSHAKTHSQYTLDIENVFKVSREGEEKRYKPFKKLHNRHLLWHGSRITNFAGILSQGLRIAPPEAPVTGYMFGKGIYFADSVSKSANYCNTSKSSPTGVLLLSEVALGNMKECHHAEFVQSLPAGVHSVKGVGRAQPDPTQNHILEDGTIVPLGSLVENKVKTDLLYNEYIVYDVAQVKVRYLFQMKFNYKF